MLHLSVFVVISWCVGARFWTYDELQISGLDENSRERDPPAVPASSPNLEHRARSRSDPLALMIGCKTPGDPQRLFGAPRLAGPPADIQP